MIKSYELTDDMLAEAEAKVKTLNQHLKNKIDQTNWQLIDADQFQLPTKSPTSPNLEVKQINWAYNQIERAANHNNLDDFFRDEKVTKIESKTERSFKETISRFTRYYSIIQANCT